ncbi:MAG: DUF4179 domain-containing protein [Cellulosilyticaceae bacterium]
MEKNIYDLINELETDLGSYEKINLSPLEEKKMMKKFRASLDEKVHTKKSMGKYGAAAAAVLIAFGSIGAVPTLAMTNNTAYKIASFLGIEKDLAPYEAIVGKEVTKDGITMIINEAIIDGDQLIISVTTTSEASIKDTFVGPAGFVYINGEVMNMGASMENQLIDDHTGLTLMKFPLLEAPTGEANVKISLRTPLADQQRSPHWDYEFKADGEALKAETKSVALGQTYSLEGKEALTLNSYHGNTLQHKITYTKLEDSLKFVEVKAVDEKGNEVVFKQGHIFGGKGSFELDSKDNQVVEDAKTLTLTLYVEGEAVGESFQLNK